MQEQRYKGTPPPPLKSKMIVMRVTTSETIQFCCVSRAIFGQLIHYYGGRSHECTADKGNCDGCKKGWAPKWKGYLHVIEMGTVQRECFLEITNTCNSLLLNQAPKDQHLRGLIFRIRKSKGGRYGRYILDVIDRREDEDKLPQEQDPQPILRYLWAAKNNACQTTA